MSIIDSIQLSGTTYQIEDINAPKTVELTQAQYDALVDKDPNTFYVITDAEAGDLTNYYTKSETNTLLGGKADTATTYTKTEVDTALATKQATLQSGTNIKTINNESILGSGNIDIQGGGKAIEAGRGISITTGETADTVSFNLPISAGTGTNSVIEGNGTTASGFSSHAEGSYSKANGSYSHAEGFGAKANGSSSHAEGGATNADGSYSHAEGDTTTAKGNYSHTEGRNTIANNLVEHASGQYNVSSSASTTFGDSGNTLFSVGNGTADNARHNAFEIRQNGDIYLSLNGQDVKLQDQLGGGGGGGVNIVQTTGTSTADVMSQDAVTTAINTVSGAIPTTYISRIKGDSFDGWTRFVRFSTPSNYNYWLLDNPKINGKQIHKFTGVESETNQFSLVETSAITTSISSSSTDAQIPSAKAVNDKLGGLSLVKLTQAEYDALATKDSNTLYLIVN